jgi:hypothetical protein
MKSSISRRSEFTMKSRFSLLIALFRYCRSCRGQAGIAFLMVMPVLTTDGYGQQIFRERVDLPGDSAEVGLRYSPAKETLRKTNYTWSVRVSGASLNFAGSVVMTAPSFGVSTQNITDYVIVASGFAGPSNVEVFKHEEPYWEYEHDEVWPDLGGLSGTFVWHWGWGGGNRYITYSWSEQGGEGGDCDTTRCHDDGPQKFEAGWVQTIGQNAEFDWTWGGKAQALRVNIMELQRIKDTGEKAYDYGFTAILDHWPEKNPIFTMGRDAYHKINACLDADGYWRIWFDPLTIPLFHDVVPPDREVNIQGGGKAWVRDLGSDETAWAESITSSEMFHAALAAARWWTRGAYWNQQHPDWPGASYFPPNGFYFKEMIWNHERVHKTNDSLSLEREYNSAFEQISRIRTPQDSLHRCKKDFLGIGREETPPEVHSALLRMETATTTASKLMDDELATDAAAYDDNNTLLARLEAWGKSKGW